MKYKDNMQNMDMNNFVDDFQEEFAGAGVFDRNIGGIKPDDMLRTGERTPKVKMCFYHPKTEAEVTCTHCGKSLCRKCGYSADEINGSADSGSVLCIDCYEKAMDAKIQHLKRRKKKIILSLVRTMVGLLPGIVLMMAVNDLWFFGLILAVIGAFIMTGTGENRNRFNSDFDDSLDMASSVPGKIIVLIKKIARGASKRIAATKSNISEMTEINKQLSAYTQKMGTA